MDKKRTFQTLVINPGSTSTKIGLYRNENAEIFVNLVHSKEDLRQFNTYWDQFDYIKNKVLDFLKNNNISLDDLDAVVSRGGLLKSLEGGTYEVNETMISVLTRQRQIWQCRFELFNQDVPYESVQEWQELGERMLTMLNHLLKKQQGFQADLQADISAKDLGLAQHPESRNEKELQEQLKALQTLNAYSLEYLSRLTTAKQLLQRLLDKLSLEIDQKSVRIKGKVIAERFQTIWYYELFVIEERPVTIRKVVVAFSILIFGIILAKYLILFFTRVVLPRTRIQTNAAAVIEKLLFYFSILILCLLSLKLVHIPLTIFTFLGGAVAIGLGFGAQNLINNFISGIVLMAERPIKVNDMIEFEGSFAYVEEIGARCTRIRTGENVHILVPNSVFLENKIINWTHSEKRVRTSISVGVAYNSPERDVERLTSPGSTRTLFDDSVYGWSAEA